jgi:hypothetical protein
VRACSRVVGLPTLPLECILACMQVVKEQKVGIKPRVVSKLSPAEGVARKEALDAGYEIAYPVSSSTADHDTTYTRGEHLGIRAMPLSAEPAVPARATVVGAHTEKSSPWHHQVLRMSSSVSATRQTDVRGSIRSAQSQDGLVAACARAQRSRFR